MTGAPAAQTAAALATRLYDEFGFDTVNMGPLAESWRAERDRPDYGVRQNAEELTANLARVPRLIQQTEPPFLPGISTTMHVLAAG